MNKSHHTRLIKQEAQRLGFDYCGISKAEFLEESDKSRDMQIVMNRMQRQNNSEFIRTVRKFYRNIKDRPEYQEKLRESKDIGYQRICWGAFI